METLLNIATFVFLATLGFGLLLLGYGLWGWLNWRRYHLPAPDMERLPTRALDEAHKGLERLRSQYFRASGEKRNRLGLEVQRLEMRIHHLQQRTNEDQFAYYQLCKRREKSWREWKKIFDHLGTVPRRERARTRASLADATRRFRELDKLVRDEWHRALALDDMNLRELHSQGVLPEEGQTSAAAAPEAETAQVKLPRSAATEADPVAAAEAREASPPSLQAGPAAPAPMAAPLQPPADATSPPFAAAASGALHQEDFALPDLPKAGLRYSDPEFSMASIPGGMLADASLTGASFAGVRLTGIQVFRHCDLPGIDLRSITLPRADKPHQFVDCDLTGASFAQAQIEYVLFLRCNLSYSQWHNARLNRVKFSECRIEGSNWTGVDLSRTIISPDMQAQADWSRALQPPLVSAPSPYAQGKGAAAPPASPTAPQAGPPSSSSISPISPMTPQRADGPQPGPPPPAAEET